MPSKSEISWKRRTDEGERVEVYAHKSGHRWQFFVRNKRFDPWQPLDPAPLEDWLKLLDAVRRRIARRLLRPEDEDRVSQLIRERFPEANVS